MYAVELTDSLCDGCGDSVRKDQARLDMRHCCRDGTDMPMTVAGNTRTCPNVEDLKAILVI